MLTNCPSCGYELPTGDGRIVKWRCRFRLYNMQTNPDEPVADSDPERHAGQPGIEIIAGLPEVANVLHQLAVQWHGTPALRGMDTEELHYKLKGLRPTISRRKGNATWRVSYDTPESFKDVPNHKPGWLARVDIERIDV